MNLKRFFKCVSLYFFYTFIWLSYLPYLSFNFSIMNRPFTCWRGRFRRRIPALRPGPAGTCWGRCSRPCSARWSPSDSKTIRIKIKAKKQFIYLNVPVRSIKNDRYYVQCTLYIYVYCIPNTWKGRSGVSKMKLMREAEQRLRKLTSPGGVKIVTFFML